MLEHIKHVVSDKKFQEDIIALLMEMCKIDTTPNSDIHVMARNEQEVFRIIKDHLLKFSFKDASVIRKNISPGIKNHPAFSKLHFTKTEACPDGLSPEEVYKNRYNLLYLINGEPSVEGRNTAINAHVDIVAPFFSPQRTGDILLGRGAIDDKGAIAVICGALSVIDRLSLENRIVLKNKITAMFVVEEETGGNGSLDLAIDKELRKRYDSILIMDCAGNKVYPANRGAVWFWCKSSIRAGAEMEEIKVKPSPLESVIFSVIEMQQEGDTIRTESDHPLFPHKPVQTCNGILGPFGEHPSRICGYVSFCITGVGDDSIFVDIKKRVNKGTTLYIEKYGDKTLLIDNSTGKPRVEKHYEVDYLPESEKVIVRVYGSTGHMGSILENDAAITKWAYIAREVFMYKLDKCLPLEMELENSDSSQYIILEGGQGFLPTHSIDEIQERMDDAFKRGVAKYLNLIGNEENMLDCKVTYDKLHNNAYSCDPGSSSVKNAWDAAIQANIIRQDDIIRGWEVSCDARLFANEYPDLPVITSGPGEIRFAHADNEQLFLPDLFDSIVFTSLYLLKETGSL